MSPRSSLYLAIDELVTNGREVSVGAVLPVYMHIAGFTTDDTTRALVAFENAIEKLPVGVTEDGRGTAAQKLWYEYWCQKLGGVQGDNRKQLCRCDCGRIYFKGHNPCAPNGGAVVGSGYVKKIGAMKTNNMVPASGYIKVRVTDLEKMPLKKKHATVKRRTRALPAATEPSASK